MRIGLDEEGDSEEEVFEDVAYLAQYPILS
jgi:hypothetical protein